MRATRVKDIVGNEAHDAVVSPFSDAPLCHPEKANEQVIQQLLSDAPSREQFARSDLAPPVIAANPLVMVRKIGLFSKRNARESVVRRIADHNNDLAATFYALRRIVL